MSLTAKSTYLAEKVRLIKEKIDPLLEWYTQMKQMGLDKLAELATEIQNILAIIHEYDQQINGLININPISIDPTVTKQVKDLLDIPKNKIGPKSRESLLAAARNLDRLNKKLADLKLKLIGYRNSAINDIAEMMESSLKGISGIDVDIQITPPDPITGNGGSIIPVITPKLIDEATALVDATLMDPTTVVNSVVTVSGVQPGSGVIVAPGVANGIITT